jgi:hypothetical protein
MGRLFCLFMSYDGRELRRAMDGGGSSYIEEGLRNGQRKVSIRGNMKEKARFFLVCFFLGGIGSLRLLSWLLMILRCTNNLAE